MMLMSRSRHFVFCLGLLACDHDARRENPLDPALTPPVILQVISADVSSGTVSLAWSPYDGSQELSVYRVLRNVAARVRVDTIAVLGAEYDAYTDSGLAPGTYSYRISALNVAGFEATSIPRTALLGPTLAGVWWASIVTWEGTDRETRGTLELTLEENGRFVVESQTNAFGRDRFHHEGTWVTNGSLLTLDYHEGLYEPVFSSDGVLFCKRDDWNSALLGTNQFAGEGDQLVDTEWRYSGRTLVFRRDGTWEMSPVSGGGADHGRWALSGPLLRIHRTMTTPFAIVAGQLHFTNPHSDFPSVLPLNRGSAGEGFFGNPFIPDQPQCR